MQYFEEIWCSGGNLANAISAISKMLRRKLAAANEASWILREFRKAWPRRINARENFDFNPNTIPTTCVAVGNLHRPAITIIRWQTHQLVSTKDFGIKQKSPKHERARARARTRRDRKIGWLLLLKQRENVCLKFQITLLSGLPPRDGKTFTIF